MIVAEAIERTLASGGLPADVLRAFLHAEDKGATDDEIAATLEREARSTHPARVSLCYAGIVEPSGQRRPGLGGGLARVWRVVAAERPCVTLQKVSLTRKEKIAAREQLVGTIRQCYTPETIPAELAKLTRWLAFKIKRDEFTR